MADLPATDAADARPQLRPPRRLPDVLKGLISVEEALDNHSGAGPAGPAHDRRHRRAGHTRVATRAAAGVSADDEARHDDLPDR